MGYRAIPKPDDFPKREQLCKRQPVDLKLQKIEEERKRLKAVLTGWMTRTNQ